jgi:RNA polymerase sigma-70 factor (ECF subfamily)
VNAFLAASRGGDFEALLALLDPDVVFRADAAAVAASLARQPQGAPLFRPEVRGGAAVAQTFVGRAQAARPALIDGVPGLVWGPGGEPRVVFILGIEGGKIVAIDLIADPDHLRRLDVTVVGD